MFFIAKTMGLETVTEGVKTEVVATMPTCPPLPIVNETVPFGTRG